MKQYKDIEPFLEQKVREVFNERIEAKGFDLEYVRTCQAAQLANPLSRSEYCWRSDTIRSTSPTCFLYLVHVGADLIVYWYDQNLDPNRVRSLN